MAAARQLMELWDIIGQNTNNYYEMFGEYLIHMAAAPHLMDFWDSIDLNTNKSY